MILDITLGEAVQALAGAASLGVALGLALARALARELRRGASA